MWLRTLLTLPLLVAPGCTDTELTDPCGADSDCATGLTCSNGVCIGAHGDDTGGSAASPTCVGERLQLKSPSLRVASTRGACLEGVATRCSADGQLQEQDCGASAQACVLDATGLPSCVSLTCRTDGECDDENPCTLDGCDSDGECTHAPRESECDDKNACTGMDRCVAGSCSGLPRKEHRLDGGANGVDGLTAVETLPDGRIVAVGYRLDKGGSANNEQAWFVVMDAAGKLVADAAYGGPGIDGLYGLATSADGETVVGVGYSSSTPDGSDQGLLVVTSPKLDSATIELVTPGSALATVAAVPTGFVLGGRSAEVGPQGWLVWMDPAGAPTGKEAFFEGGGAWLSGVAALPAGGLLAVGTRGVEGYARQGWLVGVDNDGAPNGLDTHFGGTKEERFNAVTPGANGGFAAGGYTMSTPNGDSDGWLVLFDASGKPLGTELTLGTPASDAIYDVVAVTDGGWLLVGVTYGTDDGSSDGWVVGLDSSGQVRWSPPSFGDKGGDGLLAGASLQDGGFVLVGHTADEGGNQNGWVVFFDDLGRRCP